MAFRTKRPRTSLTGRSVLITGEKVAMRVAARRVPQLEADIEALNGREFGKNSVGETGRT